MVEEVVSPLILSDLLIRFEKKAGIVPLVGFEIIFIDEIMDFRYDVSIVYFSKEQLDTST